MKMNRLPKQWVLEYRFHIVLVAFLSFKWEGVAVAQNNPVPPIPVAAVKVLQSNPHVSGLSIAHGNKLAFVDLPNTERNNLVNILLNSRNYYSGLFAVGDPPGWLIVISGSNNTVTVSCGMSRMALR